MQLIPSDIAFTAAVKAIQERKGSRQSYARMERDGGWRTKVNPDLAEFWADLDMFYRGQSSRTDLTRAGPSGVSVRSHSQRFATSGTAGVGHLAAVMHGVENDNSEAVGVGSQECLPLGRTALARSFEIVIAQGIQDLQRLGAKVVEDLECFLEGRVATAVRRPSRSLTARVPDV